jgi:hypothetical protein
VKASVFIEDGEPVQITDLSKAKARPGGAVADYNIAPEYALKLAIWGLQRIHGSSRCHGSRMTAKSVLEALAKMGDLELDSRGLPAQLAHPGNPDEVLNVWLVP